MSFEATEPKLESHEKPYIIRLLVGDAAASVVEVPRYSGYELVAERALGDLGLSPESDRIVYDVYGCQIVGDKVVAPAYFDSMSHYLLEKILDKVDKLGLEGEMWVIWARLSRIRQGSCSKWGWSAKCSHFGQTCVKTDARMQP